MTTTAPHPSDGLDRRRTVTLLMVLLALGAAVALATCHRDTTEAVPAPETSTGVASTAPPAPPPVDESPQPEQRTALSSPGQAAPEPAPVDLEHAHQHRLTLSLRDRYGLPVEDAIVYVAPPGCALARWPERSDARGEVQLIFAARAGAVPLLVTCVVWGELQTMRWLTSESEHPRTVALVVRGTAPSQEATQHVRDRDLRTLARDASKVRENRRRRQSTRDELDVLCGRTQFLFRMMDCAMCHEPDRVLRHATLAQAPLARAGLHPAARFAASLPMRPPQELLRETTRMPTANEAVAAAPGSSGDRIATLVQGFVRGPDGQPAVDEPVTWLDDSGAVLHRGRSDTRGRFRFQVNATRRMRLVAGGGELGSTEQVVTVADEHTECLLHLELASVVRGRALDEQGQPLAGWLVEFERGDGEHSDLTATAADGTFLFADTFGQGTCLLWRSGSAALPVIYDRIGLPDADPIHLQMLADAPTRARLRVSPRLPSHVRNTAVDARITQLDTGRVATLAGLGHEDALEIEGLPAGPYRVEVGAAEVGYVSSGDVHLDGRGLWDLGPMVIPAPGLVRFVPAPGETFPLAGPHEFYMRTEHLDVHVEGLPRAPDCISLRAGRHVLLWRDGAALRAVEFVVEAGLRTTVQLPSWR